MSLTAVIDLCLERSGRYDLGTVGGGIAADNGIVAYINGAIHELERMIDHPKCFGRYSVDIAAGVVDVPFQYCRAVQRVWMMNVDGELTPLSKWTLPTLRAAYPEPVSELTAGPPEIYAINYMTFGPQQDTLTAVGGASPYTAEFTYDTTGLVFGDHYSDTNIIVMPPPDQTTTITVEGLFEAQPLAANVDENFWTERESGLVVQATSLHLEDDLRNSQGQSDKHLTIKRRMAGFHGDLTQQRFAGITQFGG